MSCERIRELLPPHAGGDLDASESRVVDQHLASCDACAALLGEYLAARARLRSVEPPFGDSDYAAVRAAVLRRIENQPLRRWDRRWAAAAAIVLAVGAGAIYWTSREEPVAPPVVHVVPPPPVVDPPLRIEPVEPPAPQVAVRPARRPPRTAPVPAPLLPREPKAAVRLEIQTQDPDVRIIWFADAT